MATAHDDEERDELEQGEQEPNGWAIVPFTVPARACSDKVLCSDDLLCNDDMFIDERRGGDEEPV